MTQQRRPSRRRQHGRHQRQAFTLIEILVVIGIIIVIMGIALPALVKVLSGAKKIRGSADLAAVSTALEAYKTDHGDYPRPAAANTGFAMLGRALIGPGGTGESLPQGAVGPFLAGQCVSTGSGNSYQEFVCFAPPDASLKYQTLTGPPAAANWALITGTPAAYSDGANGPGFKVRAGGQSYGPYLDPAKFKTRGLALLDSNDNPILYFPARPGKVAQNPAGWDLVAIAYAGGAVYDSEQNVVFFQRPGDTAVVNARERMNALLVNFTGTGGNFNGRIEPTAQGEAAVTTQAYLLWAAGPDGVFGAGKPNTTVVPTKADAKDCDDVTNFRQ